MLSELELATVRAALRYWREEICPSGSSAAAPYFDRPTEACLSESEVQDLEQRLADERIRYVACELTTERLVVTTLIDGRAAATQLATSGVQICTVLLD